jgi:hypothetical protein
MTSRLHQLALAWLSFQPGGRGTAAALARALAPLAPNQSWDTLVDDLAGGGAVTRAGARIVLGEAGRAAARDLTAGVKSFAALKQSIVARALGLEPTRENVRRIAGSDGLRAGIVARARGLGTTTPGETRRALAWRLVGVDSTAPVTTASLLLRFLSRELGGIRAHSADDAFAQLAALLAEAHRRDAGALRQALFARWLEDRPVGEEPLGRFAARVLELGRKTTDGRFGPDKLFVSALLRALPHERDPAAFKDRLLQAHRAGLLALSRADLVEAMDPREVESSEIRYMGATFHFLNL